MALTLVSKVLNCSRTDLLLEDCKTIAHGKAGLMLAIYVSSVRPCLPLTVDLLQSITCLVPSLPPHSQNELTVLVAQYVLGTALLFMVQVNDANVPRLFLSVQIVRYARLD